MCVKDYIKSIKSVLNLKHMPVRNYRFGRLNKFLIAHVTERILRA